VAAELTDGGMDRPIRVVFFGGAFLEHAALRFLSALTTHPEIELSGGICQSAGFGWMHRVHDTVRRRGAMAPVALAIHAAQSLGSVLRHPRSSRVVRRNARRALERIALVPDIHAPAVLARVRAMNPDLGVIYGSPILRPELFTIPRLGTLGIHHGTLPAYRGKKTTFWEVFNGEPVAGVAIQRVNAGLDAGDILLRGEVPIGRRGYLAVDRDVQVLGIQLYVDAILAVRRGTATANPQTRSGKGKLYRDPGPRDVLRLAGRRIAGWGRRDAPLPSPHRKS
jgi:folate-dependent phosphoribosylglycinamide formyltransferase PurN